MKITIGCAYCRAAVLFVVDEIKTENRAMHVAKVTCPTCDSVFDVHLATKRKRKGKRLREIEARSEAAANEAIALAKARNKIIGDALIAMPGCTCSTASFRSSLEGGHLLSTGWSRPRDRDAKTDALLPTSPRHFHTCPLRDTEAEAEILIAHGAK